MASIKQGELTQVEKEREEAGQKQNQIGAFGTGPGRDSLRMITILGSLQLYDPGASWF